MRAKARTAALACAVVLAIAGCKERSQRGDEEGVAATGAPGRDAGPGSSAPSAAEARLLGFADLLAIDVSIYQLIETYPGAPEGKMFATGQYRWPRPRWLSAGAMRSKLEAILAAPSTAGDAEVRAYAEQVAAWLPPLIALVTYYEGRKFVDDEFDRGRREAEDLRRTAAEVARLRGPMREAVFGAWRDLVAGYRGSPRAIVAHAWMACMSIADRVMEEAQPEAIAGALSECRRSIPRIAEIAPTSGFDSDVRAAASELGDWVAQGHSSWRTGVGEVLGRFTLRYVKGWPRLSAAPAENPAP